MDRGGLEPEAAVAAGDEGGSAEGPPEPRCPLTPIQRVHGASAGPRRTEEPTSPKDEWTLP